MKVDELIDRISKRDIVLPEFQREYVWNREQAKQLLVSLIKSYPVGSLLFWNTDEPPELKNIKQLPEKFGTIQVMLDGQQRLTTLYMLITGDIPPYYTESDIQTDPRNLYYNLESGEFQFYMPVLMKDDPLWCSVVECLQGKKVNIFELARQYSDPEGSEMDLAERYNRNLNRLRDIRKIDLPAQMVPSYAKIRDAIDIFDRVNSKGTKLTDGELALTHITGKWADARRVMKSKIEELEEKGFDFNLTFMTRALTVVVAQRALFPTMHDRKREDLITGWHKVNRILDYMVNIISGQAFIHSTDDLNSNNNLIPLVAYLSLHDGRFPNEKAMKHAIHWLYAAQTRARYAGQTDQNLEHDVSIIVREDSPWQALCDQIIDQRGRIEVKANDLEGRGVQHPIFRMALIISKAHSAVDWFNGVPLGSVHGDAYYIHKHHIFPQALLYKNGFDNENHLHRKIVNEIANRAYLTAETNLSISDRAPDIYLSEVEKRFPGALKKQFVPVDPELWKVERYQDFLAARREIIARKINEFMKALIAEPEDVAERKPLRELIKMEESSTLEFKSTLQWDVVQIQKNKALRHSVLKTIVAFLNSNSGTLIIGVSDDSQVLGIDNDVDLVGGSLDKFQQLLTSLIFEQIGAQHSPSIDIRIEDIGDRQICVVEVVRGSEPAFLKGTRGKEFHIRMGNTTRILDAEETVDYIQSNWRE